MSGSPKARPAACPWPLIEIQHPDHRNVIEDTATGEQSLPRPDQRKKRPPQHGRRHRRPHRDDRRPERPSPDQRSAERTSDYPRRSHPPVEKVFGEHSVEAVILRRPKSIRRLLIAGRESYYETIIAECRQRGVPVEFMPWPDFLKIGQFTEAEKHQGILALVSPLHVYGDHDVEHLADASCVLALDQVSNPQNLAAILRSASFFHADAIILMRHRSADVTPEVQRLAVGGAEFVDVYRITNLADTIDELKELNFRVFGLDERGEKTLAQTQFSEKNVLVIGAEGEGLRHKTRDHCDELVRIPGGRRAVESLNAAVAATLGLYELYRLRG
jgi:23S rRNA (guanosine2251-2'-O)-methyltransferase